MKWVVSFLFYWGLTLPVCFAQSESPKTVSFTLKQAVQRGLESAPQLQQAEEELRSAQAGVSKAWAPFLPKLTAELSAGTFHDREPNPGDLEIPRVARDRNQYTGQLLLTQSLLAGLKDASSLAAARALRGEKEAKLAAESSRIESGIVEHYFGIQVSLRQIRVERQVLELKEKQLDDVRVQARNGRGTELEILQAEYAYKSQQPRLEKLGAELEQKKLRFARLLNLELGQTFEITDDLEAVSDRAENTKLPPLAEAFQRALAYNPDMVALMERISRFEAETGKNFSRHLPSLDLRFNFGTQAFLREDIASQDSLTYGGQLVLQVPLFSGLEGFQERRERAAGLRALRHEQASLREKLLEELDRVYRDWELTKVTLEAEKRNLKLAEQMVKKASVSYRLGRAKLLDVLDSYAQLLAAEKNLLDAMFVRVTSQMKIRGLIGMRFES